MGFSIPFIIPITAPAISKLGKSPVKVMLSGIYCGNIHTANKRPKAFSGIGSKKRNTIRLIKIRAYTGAKPLSSTNSLARLGVNYNQSKISLKRG